MRPSQIHIKRRRRKKGETDQLAAQLAPLEEQNKPAAENQIGSPIDSATNQANRDYGAIIVDNPDLKVSRDVLETGDEHRWGIEPVVLVVIIVVLSFIGFITWQISLMPAR